MNTTALTILITLLVSSQNSKYFSKNKTFSPSNYSLHLFLSFSINYIINNLETKMIENQKKKKLTMPTELMLHSILNDSSKNRSQSNNKPLYMYNSVHAFYCYLEKLIKKYYVEWKSKSDLHLIISSIHVPNKRRIVKKTKKIDLSRINCNFFLVNYYYFYNNGLFSYFFFFIL